MPFTEYTIHRVQHTPSTAYTTYCIPQVPHTPSTSNTDYYKYCIWHYPMMDCLPAPASHSALSWPSCMHFLTFPQLQLNQRVVSQLPLYMPPDLLPPDTLPPDWPLLDCSPSDQLPPSTPPIFIDHAVQVHHGVYLISGSMNRQTHSITVSEYISEFTWT